MFNFLQYIFHNNTVHCQDTEIGVIGKGLSGGERRRLAIGLEIINQPSLLMLDEPTSGLDSASALMVGNILKRLAKVKQITILCTIHQPRYALATTFDKLYFLAKGNEIYFGPSVPKCLKFFEDAGFTCPEFDNPADFLLDLVNTSLDKSDGGSPRNSLSGTNNAPQTEIQVDNGISSQLVEVSAKKPDWMSKTREEIINHLVEEYKKSEFRENALKFNVSDEDAGDKVFNAVDQSFYITPSYVVLCPVCMFEIIEDIFVYMNFVLY